MKGTHRQKIASKKGKKRNTEVGYISSSRGSFLPKDETHISHFSCIGRQNLYHCTTSFLYLSQYPTKYHEDQKKRTI